MNFDWDPGKEGRLVAERGFGFGTAALIFQDRVVTWQDARRDYGELRMIAVGRAEGRFYTLVYTDRGETALDHHGLAVESERTRPMARISLTELAKRPRRVNYAKLDATTEEDIRRYQIEDGYDPDAALPESFVVIEPLRTIRRRLGFTQAAMAALIGVEPATLRDWEKGRTAPDPVASRLIAVLAREPEAALRVLRAAVPDAA